MEANEILASIKDAGTDMKSVAKEIKTLCKEFKLRREPKTPPKLPFDYMELEGIKNVIKNLDKDGDIYNFLRDIAEGVSKDGDIYKEIAKIKPVSVTTQPVEITPPTVPDNKVPANEPPVKKEQPPTYNTVENKQQTATDNALNNKRQEVVVVGMSKEALKSLRSIFGKNIKGTEKSTGTDSTSSKVASSGLLGGLLARSGFAKAFQSGLLPVMTLAGGSLALAVGSWFNSGPFKGIMKEIGLLGSKVFLPKLKSIVLKFFPSIVKTIGDGIKAFGAKSLTVVSKIIPSTGVIGKMLGTFTRFLGPVLKRLPVIGTIINIGSAISRFTNGDIFGGLIDIGSAVAVLIPGVGTAISIGLGILNAARDLSGASQSKAEPVNVSAYLKKGRDWVTGKLKTVFNWYFGKFGRGYDQIKSGDYMRGLVTLASVIPSFVWFEGVYNWLVGAPEPRSETSTPEELPSDVLGGAWNWLTNKISTVVGNFFGKISDGWDSLKKGQYIEGLVTWSSMVPGLGWISSISKWASTPEAPESVTETDNDNAPIVGAFSFLKSIISKKISKVKDMIGNKVKSVAKGITNTWDKVTGWFSKEDPPEIKVEEAKGIAMAKTYDRPAPQKVQAAVKQAREAAARVAVQKEPQESIKTGSQVSSKEDNSKILKVLEGIYNKVGGESTESKSTTNNAANVSTVTDNSVANLYGNNTERDVPYAERNKYRQQFVYSRNIL